MSEKIILTSHAKKRMVERNIKLNDISNVIGFPEYTVTKGNKIEAHKKIGGRMFKIIYEFKDKFIKIITVIEK